MFLDNSSIFAPMNGVAGARVAPLLVLRPVYASYLTTDGLFAALNACLPCLADENMEQSRLGDGDVRCVQAAAVGFELLREEEPASDVHFRVVCVSYIK
jgi:hypothetical protein